MEGVLGADFSVKHHWNLSQKLLELDSGNKLHEIIAKTLVGDVDHLADFQKAEVSSFFTIGTNLYCIILALNLEILWFIEETYEKSGTFF